VPLLQLMRRTVARLVSLVYTRSCERVTVQRQETRGQSRSKRRLSHSAFSPCIGLQTINNADDVFTPASSAVHTSSLRIPLQEYDTIRDVTLTCARKPTRVSLIYRTVTTTKKYKTEKKLKSKNAYAQK